MEKSVKNLIECTQDVYSMYLSTKRYLHNNILKVIEVLQEGVGYVDFNDESGLPDYHHNILDGYSHIYAVRVVDEKGYKQMEFMIEDNYNGDMDNDTWIKVYDFQIDICEIFSCICQRFNIE